MSEKTPKPYIPATATRIPELTPGALLMGVLLGIIFGTSSLYLTLKVGMSVSASIPVAVLSITLFRGIARMFGIRQATILENNIVQTTGSAGESIAFGVAVTMPALMIMGYDMDLTRVMLSAVLGSVLGVLMMIPLRRTLIVEEHENLPYPEGRACAEVLIVGEKGGGSAKTVFLGFFFGLIYKFFNIGLRLWKEIPRKELSFFKGASVAAEVSPELVGVGYIIGPQVASTTLAGGLLSSWVLIPMIVLFGSGSNEPLFPSTHLIRDMSIHEIWKTYVMYIGAGCVATAGIISMIGSMPLIVKGALGGIRSIKSKKDSNLSKTESNDSRVSHDSSVSGPNTANERTNQDLSMKFVLIGCFILLSLITAIPSLSMNIFGAILILTLGFLFVAVSSRLTGQIGASSNPVSGMTVATLLITCLAFVLMGWVGPEYRVTALSVAAIVCVAISNAGATSQDLKTGFFVGATPRSQQIGLLIGATASALVIGWTLSLLNEASTVYSQKNLPKNIIDVSQLNEKMKFKDANNSNNLSETSEYYVLRVTEPSLSGPLAGIDAGKYLVDPTSKQISYLVDPGINGKLNTRDDGSIVQKYEAPKARLMSLIIDGILTHKLPWGLVLLGAAIALLVHMCGAPVLAFAVGVYLPLSTSVPIFIGGLLRYISDAWIMRRRGKSKENSNDADLESSPGVLWASGLIAGGSIAGIGLALVLSDQARSNAFNLGSKFFHEFSESNFWASVIFSIIGLLTIYMATRPNPDTEQHTNTTATGHRK